MTEIVDSNPVTIIVTSKNRRGATRYGWKCSCGRAAGAWPARQTAESSRRSHEIYRCTARSKS